MVTATMKLEHLTRVLKGQMIRGAEKVVEFNEAMLKDPSYALSWGDNMFKMAMSMTIASQVLRSIEGSDKTAEELIAHVTTFAKHNLMLGAMSPMRSTSICKNLIEQERTVAWAEVLDLIED